MNTNNNEISGFYTGIIKKIFIVLAICSILVGCAHHSTAHESHEYGEQTPTKHNVPERNVTTTVPEVIQCPDSVSSAFKKAGLTLVGVVSIYQENGTIGACSPEELRPLQPGETKTLHINNESVDQITIIRGSHCFCVNGECYC